MLRPLFAALAVALILLTPAAIGAPVQDDAAPDYSAMSLSDLADLIEKKRDQVDDAVIPAIGALQSRDALDVLIEAYGKLGSIYMKREVVRALVLFDDIDECSGKALEFVMNVATAERKRELRLAALRALGKASENGRRYLKLIVESAAADEVRELALEYHILMGDEGDHPWYRDVYARTMKAARKEASDLADEYEKAARKARKDEVVERPKVVWPTAKLRAASMKAIITELKDSDLEEIFDKDPSMTVKRAALQELANRGAEKAPVFARQILARNDFSGSDRVLAVEILVDVERGDAAKELIKMATKSITPEVLRQRIADLLSDLNDEDVDRQLLKLVGKGKGIQKAFALRATKRYGDEKYVKKIRKGLRDKDDEVVLATADALAARKDRESLEDMQKILEKTDNSKVRRGVLEACSTIYDGENDWLEQLVVYSADEQPELRNAALVEIARLGRRNMDELFLERLTHPNWSTRLVALQALEGRREVEHLEPLIAQMQKETGRMLTQFSETLFRLTGKPFGRNAQTWQRWFENEGATAELISLSELEELSDDVEDRRLRDVYASAPDFFGIEIDSHRVMFVIDVSGSMNAPTRVEFAGELGPSRMDVAKEELVKAIESLEETALFNVAAFSGGVDSWLEGGLAESGDMAREDAILWVSRLGALGGTNLYGGLEFAFDDLDVDTVFILSDGEPSAGDFIDPFLIREVVDERNEARRIVIHAVAIGAQLQVLEWLAEDSGGTYLEIQ